MTPTKEQAVRLILRFVGVGKGEEMRAKVCNYTLQEMKATVLSWIFTDCQKHYHVVPLSGCRSAFISAEIAITRCWRIAQKPDDSRTYRDFRSIYRYCLDLCVSVCTTAEWKLAMLTTSRRAPFSNINACMTLKYSLSSAASPMIVQKLKRIQSNTPHTPTPQADRSVRTCHNPSISDVKIRDHFCSSENTE